MGQKEATLLNAHVYPINREDIPVLVVLVVDRYPLIRPRVSTDLIGKALNFVSDLTTIVVDQIEDVMVPRVIDDISWEVKLDRDPSKERQFFTKELILRLLRVNRAFWVFNCLALTSLFA